MPLPDDLAPALQQQPDAVPRHKLIAAAEDLSYRYRREDRDATPSFMTSDTHRLAYLAVRMPATFA